MFWCKAKTVRYPVSLCSLDHYCSQITPKAPFLMAPTNQPTWLIIFVYSYLLVLTARPPASLLILLHSNPPTRLLLYQPTYLRTYVPTCLSTYQPYLLPTYLHSKLFPFRVDPFSDWIWCTVKQTGSHKSCLPCTKWLKIYNGCCCKVFTDISKLLETFRSAVTIFGGR